MANAINPIRNAVRSCLRRHRQRDYIREEKEKLARHNKTLGLHISWKELCRARRKTGCCVDEYFHFAFYNKTDAQRDPYLTLYRQDLIAEKVGDVHRPLTIPGNKVLFHTIFGEFFTGRAVCQAGKPSGILSVQAAFRGSDGICGERRRRSADDLWAGGLYVSKRGFHCGNGHLQYGD